MLHGQLDLVLLYLFFELLVDQEEVVEVLLAQFLQIRDLDLKLARGFRVAQEVVETEI